MALCASACAGEQALTTVAQGVEAGVPPAPVYQRFFTDAITGDNAPVSVTGTANNCPPGWPCWIADANLGSSGPVDSFKDDIYERPAGRGNAARTYYPAIDIVSTQVGLTTSWLYYRIDLFGPEAGQSSGTAAAFPHFYAFEINLDDDPAGDAVVEVAQPTAAWSNAGVRVHVDSDDTIGGPRGFVADGAGHAGGGYEDTLFDTGVNTAFGAPGGATAVQARIVGNSVELAVFRPFLASTTPSVILKAAVRGYASRSDVGPNRLYLHDDRSRATLGSPYPYLEHAGAPACPNGVAGDDGLTAAQISALESGTGVNTGRANPCYALAGIYELDNTATVATLAVQDALQFQADLSLAMTDDVDPVDGGGAITYTLTATNATTGGGSATGVVITATVPAGATFLDASPACSHAGGTVTCALGTLPNGMARTVTITVRAPMTSGVLANTATVTSDSDDPMPADNAATETTTVEGEEPRCGDGHLDADEACDDGDTDEGDGCSATCTEETDTDGDGVVDLVDLDDDNDGILDSEEGGGARDVDGDGMPDSRDHDTDNDGIADVVEAGHGVLACSTTVGGNGLCDDLETAADAGLVAYAMVDSDRDTVHDYADLDSDNDGHVDLREADATCADANADAMCDVSDGTSLVLVPTDTDVDGTPDYRDVESDGDLVSDLVESSNAVLDTDRDGVIDRSEDLDGDGLLDVIDDGDLDGALDSDDDGMPDHRDVDADNDTVGDHTDNCRLVENTDQLDRDRNGRGDACDAVQTEVWGIQGGGCRTTRGSAGGLVLLVLLGVVGRRRRTVAPLAALGLVVVPTGARADEVRGEFSTERFQLASDQDGILDVEWGGVQPHLQLDLALWLGYANDPLTVYRQTPTGERTFAGSLVKDQVGGELVGAIGLFDRAQLGVSVPLIVAQRDDLVGTTATMPTAPDGGFAVGDVRLVPKVRLMRQADAGVELAIYAALTLPTSSGNSFTGDATATAAPALAVSRRFRNGGRAGINLGYRARRERMAVDLQIDDEVFAAIGAAVNAGALEVDLGFAYATSAEDVFATSNQNYAELKAGASYRITPSVRAFAATGAGVANGFGTPDWRLLAGMRLERAPALRPPALRSEPYPRPEPLPRRASPPLTRPVRVVAMPPVIAPPAVVAPLPVVAPPVVTPPVVARPPDRDGDGITDELDSCPDAAGTAAHHGCTTPPLVQLTETGLELAQRIRFTNGKATIDKRSHALLDNIAAVLRAQTQLHVVIESHTDKDADLKQARSRATEVLRYLVRKGVDVRRLDTKALGGATAPRIELVRAPR
ncbi:MAG: OmpA family protein [Kofleriaceae bacterium]|nr:OmpA family protein [Kofleriaceae bacterium]